MRRTENLNSSCLPGPMPAPQGSGQREWVPRWRPRPPRGAGPFPACRVRPWAGGARCIPTWDCSISASAHVVLAHRRDLGAGPAPPGPSPRGGAGIAAPAPVSAAPAPELTAPAPESRCPGTGLLRRGKGLLCQGKEFERIGVCRVDAIPQSLKPSAKACNSPNLDTYSAL